MSKEITILGEKILPGKSYQIKMDIARLHTRTKIEVAVIVSRAKKDGPCVLVSAGIHGNEVNGIEIVRQIVANKYNVPDAGMIICVPVVNVFGFIIKTREFPDGKDLNRSFPGTKKGSLASNFAYSFMNEVVEYADYCIDFHTGGDDRFNYPQVRISEDDTDTFNLAKIFGAKFVKYSSERDKSFRASAVAIGKKVLLYEGGKSLDINNKVTHVGVTGILNVLDHLGVKKFPATYKPFDKDEEQVVFSDSKWIRASASGMYRSLLRNGDPVEKGAVIGLITDPYGFFERKIKASVSGYIICLNHSPIVNQGDAIAHIAIHDS
ncbi:succinylglutamate desuccinylase/aspartoacylase family protein [Tenacibaculum sp. AHE15PA]|uniref:succinylglutamate desuccinylase/aspartoacylase family protein n=1 Tax=unclassified Tenacibaculum TaxID=2635139 RepID=UPI001C4F2B61|nr:MULTISPECIES: succinylglutamate desuccinylase/aspartoacylase family protein [unclassified Tenacibaculum]QXP74291.1 succinylglutamate desuccinylase/aspartoacylase family protein [Tenacibaculum sp. AHE14PA]QXP75339.1 succinylglutamate desuccinylase/aspartoacylase family protein [Tenacibaculum sp. AHE15PA]